MITGDHLLKIYQNIYTSLAHNQVDLDYFKQSKVRIFYRDREENMIGGFCIYSGPNYRTFLPLKPEILQQIKQENHFDKKPPYEITCLWIEEKSRHSSWIVFLFFIMILDVIRLPRRSIIFGTHGKNISIYFSPCLPKVIFYEKLFVATKKDVFDFWIRKGSKFQIVKGFFILSSVRLFLGRNALLRFRLKMDKDRSIPK